MEIWAGRVCGTGVIAWVNKVPSEANLSILGVVKWGYP